MLKTASGRGYRLLGSWTPRHQVSAASVAPRLMREPGVPPANHFPMIVGRLIGRAEAIRRVRDFISAYRVVTLTGPGGIGKTSLAIEAAAALSPTSMAADGLSNWPRCPIPTSCHPRWPARSG